AELRQLVGLHPDTDRVRVRPHMRIAYAWHAAHLIEDVERRIAAQRKHVVAAVRRAERDDLQQARRRLAHHHALTTHFLGQAGHSGLNAVVDVDRGEVRIGAHGERDIDGERAVAGADGAHVQHVFYAVDLLFERR